MFREGRKLDLGTQNMVTKYLGWGRYYAFLTDRGICHAAKYAPAFPVFPGFKTVRLLRRPYFKLSIRFIDQPLRIHF